MVVTSAHPVEQRRVHLSAKRLSGTFEHLELQHHPVAANIEAQLRFVYELLVLDDVFRHAAVHREELVAGPQAELLSY